MRKTVKLFLIPLGVGLIVAFIQFGLPYLFKESKELTYKISEPINYLDPNKTGKLDIKINGINSPYLVANQFSIENTGQVPLKDIAVLINFSSTDSLFRIYNFSIDTEPRLEFGKIEPEMTTNIIKLKFDLINPKDKVYINILTNDKAKTELFSKSEGMILKQASESKHDNKKTSFLFTLLASILSTLLAFFSIGKSISSFNSVKTFVENLFSAKQTRDLTIISAFYGKRDKYFDVTEHLNKSIKDNRLEIKVSNEIAGDPIYGVRKDLNVVYSFGNEIFRIVKIENEILIIPDEKNAT